MAGNDGGAVVARRSGSPYTLCSRLAALELPSGPETPVRNADDMLEAVVTGSDSRGRYFATPKLLRRLFWWDTKPVSLVARWTAELVQRDDVTIHVGAATNCCGGVLDVIQVNRRRRFARWADREPIPDGVRRAVYDRDGWRCVDCGATEALSLDHIHPWSLGGPDTLENLQTLCRSCNSRKGARV